MRLFFSTGLLSLLILSACDVQINKDFNIPDNTKVENDLISVNGNINIGKNCTILSDLSTVNGEITIGDETVVESSIQTVNGDIIVHKNVAITGDITNLTGNIELNEASVTGTISSISGNINARGLFLSGDLVSNFGNINIYKKSTVKGSVVIDDNDEIPEKLRTVMITVKDSSVVSGDLRNDNRQVIVSVFVEEGSAIAGSIIDAEIANNPEEFENE